MKKILAVTLAIVMLAGTFFLTGCDGDKLKELGETEVKTIVDTEYEAIQKSIDEKADYETVISYIKKWADSSKIKVSDTTDNTLVLHLPTVEGYEKAEDVTLQLPIGYYERDRENQMLATALAALKSFRNHGDIKMIFTKVAHENFDGASSLDEKYLDTDNFINLMWASTPTVYNRGASGSTYTVSKEIIRQAPSYDKAYKLVISGLSGGSVRNISSDKVYACPIMTIMKFLAAQKAKGFIFEVASLKGGRHGDTFAKSASAVLVIPNSETQKMNDKYAASCENFEEKYGEQEPNFKYTLTEVSLPSSVLTEETSDSIINLLYTIDTGLNRNKSGMIVSGTNIGTISTESDTFRLAAFTENTDSMNLQDTKSEFETSCGLYGFSFKADDEYSPWITDKNNRLVTELAKKANSDILGTITQTENIVFKTRQPKLNAISYGANESCGTKAILALTKYIASLDQPEE